MEALRVILEMYGGCLWKVWGVSPWAFLARGGSPWAFPRYPRVQTGKQGYRQVKQGHRQVKQGYRQVNKGQIKG